MTRAAPGDFAGCTRIRSGYGGLGGALEPGNYLYVRQGTGYELLLTTNVLVSKWRLLERATMWLFVANSLG